MSLESKRPHYLFALLLLTSCGASSPEGQSEETSDTTGEGLIANITYGAACQGDFQNSWAGALNNANSNCNNFLGSMDGAASRTYYLNLKGGKSFYEETPNDNVYLENVDIHYNNSHGGAGVAMGWQVSDGAVFAMWDFWSLAKSPQMRLGNEGRGLSVLVSHSCEQLLVDADVWTRWAPVMRGGLRIALAANGDVLDNASAGKRFADNLKAGQTFWNAWYNGMIAAAGGNKPAVIVSGVSDTDCWNRLSGMKLSNFKGAAYPVLRDDAIKNYCMVFTN